MHAKFFGRRSGLDRGRDRRRCHGKICFSSVWSQFGIFPCCCRLTNLEAPLIRRNTVLPTVSSTFSPCGCLQVALLTRHYQQRKSATFTTSTGKPFCPAPSSCPYSHQITRQPNLTQSENLPRRPTLHSLQRSPSFSTH